MANGSLHPLLHYLRRLSGGPSAGGDLDDAQLLRRFQSDRDETAFTAIVQRYGAMVWALCVRRLGETSEAEDAFQATFLVLVRKASSLRGPELLGPWLHGVAYRTALKVRGQRARQALREAPLSDQAATERPEQVWCDLRPVIDEEVNRLPEKYRRPVVLCYLQGLSSDEAAQRLGCARGTVFSRLARARDLLRRRLARRGLGVSAGVLAVVLSEQAAARALPPAALSEATIRTGLAFAAGTASQALSAPLAALVEGVLRSMFLSKVQFAAIVLLALGLVGTGAGFVARRTSAEQPKPQPAAVPAPPAGVVEKTKDKTPPAKPKPKADEPFEFAGPDWPSHLTDWRDKLLQPVEFPGFDDPKTTLTEALDAIHDHYHLTFSINQKAFTAEEIMDVGKTEIAQPNPIRPIKAGLATVLRAILDRVPAESGVVFLLRRDHVEITTTKFLRAELGYPEERPILPLVWDAYEETQLVRILPRLAEISGFNVVADPHAKEQLQTKITAQFNNVPVDTVLLLLANMSDLRVVRLGNVFYVTTPENAKHLHEEQNRVPGAGTKPTAAK